MVREEGMGVFQSEGEACAKAQRWVRLWHVSGTLWDINAKGFQLKKKKKKRLLTVGNKTCDLVSFVQG